MPCSIQALTPQKHRPVVRMDMSTIPVLGSVADCFSASRWRRLASSTSTVSTFSEKRTLAWASARRIRDSSCRGYAETIPLPLPIFLMSTYAWKMSHEVFQQTLYYSLFSESTSSSVSSFRIQASHLNTVFLFILHWRMSTSHTLPCYKAIKPG